MTQRSSDAPQNYQEFLRWREAKGAHICNDHYLREVDRKWRSLGRQVRHPASLRGVENHT